MKHFMVLVSSFLLALTLHAEGCWSALELSEYELKTFDNVATFSFKDAIDCTPVPFVTIDFLGKRFQADKNGLLKMELPPEDIDAEVPVTIRKEGYMGIKQTIPVSFGTYWQSRFLISKEIPLESARFVLAWDAKPSDLDLHLKSDDFHVSFRKTRSIPDRVRLDRDAIEGYGPETITLDRVRQTKQYQLLVHRYSSDGKISKKDNVSVYLNGKLDNVVHLDDTDATCIEIATIQNNQTTYTVKALPDSECR